MNEPSYRRLHETGELKAEVSEYCDVLRSAESAGLKGPDARRSMLLL
jgi:hypothetical protein